MNAAHAHLTFHLRGLHAGSPLTRPDPAEVRPALLGRYQDLTELRYDYPLVLFSDGRVQALSGVVDGLLKDAATGEDADRISRHVLRLERRIRQLVSQGAGGSLQGLWTGAALDLHADRDAALTDSLDRARAALTHDGDVVDCGLDAPGRVLGHLWRAAQAAKARALARDLDVLTHRLSDILHAESAASAAGRTAARLRASLGPREHDAFDFDILSRILQPAAPVAGLSDGQRDRIARTLHLLTTRRFFPAAGEPGYSFAFTSAVDALEAYLARRAELMELASAIEIARIEVDGSWDEASHDAVVSAADRAPLDPAIQAMLPDYFVDIQAGRLDPAEQAALLEMLAAGLPVRVLLRTDDLLDASPLEPSHFGFGFTNRQIVNTVIGLNDAFVLQAPASHLLKHVDDLRRGFEYAGPALFSVFTGATGHTHVPLYLLAAAALESRAFPAFVYDPSRGQDWAARFSIAGNPDVDADWPAHPLAYETAAHHATGSDLTFTFADFVLCDARHIAHFATADRTDPEQTMSVAEAVAARPEDRNWHRVPSVLAVNRGHRLERLVVDDVLVEQTRRCRAIWRSLQELGGVHNSHARLAAERERASRTHETPAGDAGLDEQASVSEQAAALPEPPVVGDDPYIETPRCSTCNECVQINSRMFGYNDNRQAYIVDRSAGTYRQLVEAAEGCQVSIIHPGKPRDLNEPGLDELLQRAAAFL